MSMSKLVRGVILLTFLIPGIAYASESLETTRAAFAKAMAAKDFDSIVLHFDEKGILVNQDGSLAHGHEEIKEGFRKILSNDKMRVRSVPDSSKAVQNGDIILRSGRWQLVGSDGTVHEEWFASEVFRKNAQGKWVYLIDNPYNTISK